MLFCRRFEDTVRPVLFEDSRVGEHICGFTDNYIRVHLPYDSRLANRIVPVEITSGNLQLGEE